MKKLARQFNEDNWPTPQSNEGEPWPKPDQTLHHQGGMECPCPTCVPPHPVKLAPGVPMPDTKGSPTWPHVFAFACAMEFKLSVNRRKGDAAGWRRSGADALSERLDAEVEELDEALGVYYSAHRDERDEKARKDVLLEAADVANFAMMIADCVTNEN